MRLHGSFQEARLQCTFHGRQCVVCATVGLPGNQNPACATGVPWGWTGTRSIPLCPLRKRCAVLQLWVCVNLIHHHGLDLVGRVWNTYVIYNI